MGDGKKKIEEMISKDLINIWNSIKKPESLISSKFQDFFEIEIVFLSHKLYAEDKFNEEIVQLKERFTKHFEGIYSKGNEGYENNMRIIDLPVFIKNAWNAIMSQKDINIPSQKEMVASLRCSEFKDAALKAVSEDIAQLQITHDYKAKEYHTISFKIEYNRINAKALTIYDEECKPYYKNIADMVRAELIKCLNEGMYRSQRSKIMEYCQHICFNYELNIKTIRCMKQENFKDIIEVLQASSISMLSDYIKKELIEDDTLNDWKFEREFDTLKNKLIEKKEEHIRRELNKVIDVWKEKAVNKAYDVVELAFIKIQHSFWEKFSEKYLSSWKEIESSAAKVFTINLSMRTEEIYEQLCKLKGSFYKAAIKSMKVQVLKLDDGLLEFFRKDFNYNTENHRVDWRKIIEEDIVNRFHSSSRKTLAVLKDFKLISSAYCSKWEENTQKSGTVEDYGASLCLMDENDFQQISEKLNDKIEDEFELARRKHVCD